MVPFIVCAPRKIPVLLKEADLLPIVFVIGVDDVIGKPFFLEVFRNGKEVMSSQIVQVRIAHDLLNVAAGILGYLRAHDDAAYGLNLLTRISKGRQYFMRKPNGERFIVEILFDESNVVQNRSGPQQLQIGTGDIFLLT